MEDFLKVQGSKTNTGYVKTMKRNGSYPITKISVTNDRQSLVPIGDVHLGADNWNEELFKKTLSYAKTNNSLIILMGDLIENANKFSVGAGVYNQKLNPQEQIDKIVEYLQPFKENIIGCVDGNHERRALKDTGISISSVICSILNVPFFNNEFFGIITKEGVSSYTIYGNHSDSVGKNEEMNANSIDRDWSSWLDFDLLLKAHSHSRGLYGPKIKMTVDQANMAIVEKERWYCLTGNYLNRLNSYATYKPYRPKAIGGIGLWLDMRKDHKKITSEPID